MGDLGKHDLDLSYEPVGGDPIDRSLADMVIAGGCTVAAAFVDIPDVGKKPVLVFTFWAPDGKMIRPIAFISDPGQMRKLRPLVDSAVSEACRGAGS